MTKGIDVSSWNNVDWQKLKSDGCAFALIKATDGATYSDHLLDAHAGGAKSVGILRGAYHFLRANDSGLEQAMFFLNRVRNIDFELPYVLDLEEAGKMNGTVIATVRCAKDFLQHLLSNAQKTPLLYVDTSFAETLRLNSDPFFAQFPLWLANYSKTPAVPPPWKAWTIWQYTNRGEVGIANPQGVDTDLFNGSVDELKMLGQKKAV